ncbi:DUF1996 domain-containing protein [Streptomyces sp. NBC_01216]|uniref:DUF1996 domain-containing protein n=1 Tax=unclassified Streptomyces TaxID=2593676 RepID=UPI002E1456CE|nr:DUF1996 domain-containing protein [Streptomyces sp. NBC_01216]
MGRTRKRSTRVKRAVAASVALILGAGGVVAANVYASAGEGRRGKQPDRGTTALSTIDCPEVADSLPAVPDQVRGAVDRQLATLDSQITVAYRRFADNKRRVERDPDFAEQQILTPLKNERVNIIQRIVALLGQEGEAPQGLKDLAPCALREDDERKNGGQDGNGESGGGGEAGQGQAGNGPVASDFADIRSVRPNARLPRPRSGASRGTFVTDCGRNTNGKFNPDNIIVAPGVSNGAHHMHDYVGNQANDAFAGDDELAAGQTTCRNQGDRSTYYWPVLRLQNGQAEDDAQADGGGKDQNVGEIQTPAQVTLNFVGNPVSKVTAMPRFLRIITGDAKAFTNGNANANASWSCTGFENRQLKDKYPICPQGSKVVRTFRFQSCWDGKNADSANHRTHVAFADPRSGRCGKGFRAIPQLVQRIVYNVPPGPGFAVDSFPEQLHKPVTDHGDFINVFDQRLMNRMVRCINAGRRCS